MPIVLEGTELPRETLVALLTSLKDDLAETGELIESPRGPVLHPASLRTAAELLASARSVLDLPSPAGTAELAARANLAYATMLAVIDLVKSHTDVPKVPRSRSTPASP